MPTIQQEGFAISETSVKFDSKYLDIINKLCNLLGFQSQFNNEKLCYLLNFIDKNYANLSSHELLETSEGIEAPACSFRIFHQGNYWCVNKPPKMTELKTLQICKVCKARKYHFSDRTLAQPQPTPKPITDPKKDLNKYGMVYCSFGGLWVFPEKCGKCKKDNYPRYDSCQKQKVSL